MSRNLRLARAQKEKERDEVDVTISPAEPLKSEKVNQKHEVEEGCASSHGSVDASPEAALSPQAILEIKRKVRRRKRSRSIQAKYGQA